jgi:hypothetical protein
MARSITLTLGAGLGADLGPNFNLTADVGSVSPSTATKTELTTGKSVSVDDAATQVTVTSTGTCTNAITQTIPCAGGTTSTTTTTTTAAPTCRQFVTYTNGNSGDGGSLEYYDCNNVYQTISVANEDGNKYFCALSGTINQISGTGVNWSDQGVCTMTTTTTTTTAPPLTQVNINLCAGGADGSGYVDVYAYSTEAVDTQISIPFRWTGDLSSVYEGTVLINSGLTCGTTNVLAGQTGENFSNLEFIGNISPQQSLNQEYVPLFAGSGSPCTSC